LQYIDGEDAVIELTALSGRKFWINPHQIETMEANPDTTLSLVYGKRIVVAETPEQVLERIVAYRRSIAGFDARAGSVLLGETD
jgi:flagellar protein FlbD